MRTQRRLRTAQFVLFALLLLVLVAAGADQAIVTIAEGQIAQRAARYGFTGQPSVTLLGFPFAPQLLTGHLDGLNLTARGLRSGGLTATHIHAQVRGIVLGSGGHHPTTLTRLTGTGLVPFTDLERLAGAHVPGLVIAADGPGQPHRVSLRLTVAILTITAVATVALSPAGAVVLHIVSAPGVPSFVLNHFRVITIHLPKLPLGLAVQQVTIVRSGALVSVSGHNVKVSGSS